MNRIIITGVVLSIVTSTKSNELLYKFKVDNQNESILLKFIFQKYDKLVKFKDNIEENTPLLIIGFLSRYNEKLGIVVERVYYLETLYDKLMNTFLDEEELTQVMSEIETDTFDIIKELNELED